MKVLKYFIGMFAILIFSSSIFAQKSSYFNGEYVMNYGDHSSQRMEIITNGGKYYTARFSGECNARTVEGSVRNGVLEIPIVGGYNDKIIIRWKGSDLDVSVTNEGVMRESCGGYSIEGVYKMKNTYNNNYNNTYNNDYSHKKYNSDNFNNSYHSRDSRAYGSHAYVHDLMKISAPLAYDKLKERGFHLVKGGGKYKVWYNEETNQCIKTISINQHIHDVLKSTHCH